MATVVALFQDSGFDPETIEIMARAYEKARKSLHDKGQPSVVQEVIAGRIIAAAATGERDPDRLCRSALTALDTNVVFET
jgi:hypothetical protein